MDCLWMYKSLIMCLLLYIVLSSISNCLYIEITYGA